MKKLIAGFVLGAFVGGCAAWLERSRRSDLDSRAIIVAHELARVSLLTGTLMLNDDGESERIHRVLRNQLEESIDSLEDNSDAGFSDFYTLSNLTTSLDQLIDYLEIVDPSDPLIHRADRLADDLWPDRSTRRAN